MDFYVEVAYITVYTGKRTAALLTVLNEFWLFEDISASFTGFKSQCKHQLASIECMIAGHLTEADHIEEQRRFCALSSSVQGVNYHFHFSFSKEHKCTARSKKDRQRLTTRKLQLRGSCVVIILYTIAIDFHGISSHWPF